MDECLLKEQMLRVKIHTFVGAVHAPSDTLAGAVTLSVLMDKLMERVPCRP